MATIALATTQSEYLNLYIQIHGKKPSVGQYNAWENEVKKAKSQLKAARTRRANKREKAVADWNTADTSQRIEMLSKVLQHKVADKAADPAIDALYKQISADTHYARLYEYLLGVAQANQKAKADDTPVTSVSAPLKFASGFIRRGFMAAKNDVQMTLEKQIEYINSPSSVRL